MGANLNQHLAPRVLPHKTGLMAPTVSLSAAFAHGRYLAIHLECEQNAHLVAWTVLEGLQTLAMTQLLALLGRVHCLAFVLAAIQECSVVALWKMLAHEFGTTMLLLVEYCLVKILQRHGRNPLVCPN